MLIKKKISTKKIIKPIAIKAEPLKITESLKNKVFPYIIKDFADALKSLEVGESLQFGRLGAFKKVARKGKNLKNPRDKKIYTGYQYSFKAFSLLKN